MAVPVLGFSGMFGAFTYIVDTLTEVSGFAASAVRWLLVPFGTDLLIGNVVGGRFADRALDRGLLVIRGALVLVLAGFALAAPNPVATAVLIFLMGGFGFATVPGLQTRVLTYAAHAPSPASAGNIAGFNVGNALGAWLGGSPSAPGLATPHRSGPGRCSPSAPCWSWPWPPGPPRAPLSIRAGPPPRPSATA